VLPVDAVCYAKQRGACESCDAGTCAVGGKVAALAQSKSLAAEVSAAASIAEVLQAAAQQRKVPSPAATAAKRPMPQIEFGAFGDGDTEEIVPESTNVHASGDNGEDPVAADQPPAQTAVPDGGGAGDDDPRHQNGGDDGVAGGHGPVPPPFAGDMRPTHAMGGHAMGPPPLPPGFEGGIQYHNGQPFMMTPQGMFPVQFIPGPNGRMMAAPMPTPYFFPPQGMMMPPGGVGGHDDPMAAGLPYGGSGMMAYSHMQPPYGGAYYGHQGTHPHMYQQQQAPPPRSEGPQSH